eukprot:scaffold109972_cov26-Tisochrysis_lutea.AAC.1
MLWESNQLCRPASWSTIPIMHLPCKEQRKCLHSVDQDAGAMRRTAIRPSPQHFSKVPSPA